MCARHMCSKQNNLFARIPNWKHENSGWKFHSMLRHQLVCSQITSCQGSSYFSLSKELNNSMKELIDIKNDDNECFICYIVRYLNAAD